MRQIKNTIQNYLSLLRIQTAAATASAPLLGGLVMGQRDVMHLAVLFIIGLLVHIFGFVLNEYVDIEIDRKSTDLKKKPLVSGDITKNQALIVVIISILCGYGLIIIFYRSIYPITFFSLAIILGGLYDLYGKRIVGMDFILAGALFFICITGASTISINFNILVYLVCLVYFFQIAYNNAVEGGLKDVDHDGIGGAKTMAISMGVNVRQGLLQITKSFVGFAYCLRFIFLGLLVFIGSQPQLNFWSYKNILHILIILFLTVIYIGTLSRFLKSMKFDRSRLKRLFSLHEMTSYFMVIIVLSTLFDLQITIFLIFLPAIWYLVTNLFLYGKLLEPRV
jgi:4-hydroxybenzoate polyprenyltransferase